jgi:hypothetical protein
MMFDIRVLRRIFVPKREEVTEYWKKLRNEELNNLYIFIEEDEMGGT